MLNLLLGEEERAVSRQNIPGPTPLSLALEAWSSGAASWALGSRQLAPLPRPPAHPLLCSPVGLPARIQYPRGEMRGLTAVCAAARHISLTGGWSGRMVGAGGSKRRRRGRPGRGDAPGQGSRAAEVSQQRDLARQTPWKQALPRPRGNQEPTLSPVGASAAL